MVSIVGAACARATEPVARTSRPAATARDSPLEIEAFPVPSGSHPHDVAPAPDGTVWYTAQSAGKVGRLDPSDGSIKEVALGPGSAPHGVIVGPDGAAWVTDPGLNALVRVDSKTHAVRKFSPSAGETPSFHTAVFDTDGVLWFTGQDGFFGRMNPKDAKVETFAAPSGRGPYGITATPRGEVYFASLAASYVARVDKRQGRVQRLDPPTKEQGARRVWSDSKGRIWVTEWNAGNLALYDPGSRRWREWRVPGANPQPYAVFVDDEDIVWVSDFGANAIHRFDPSTQAFASIRLPASPGHVRQLLGRPGEVWGAESAADALVRIKTRR